MTSIRGENISTACAATMLVFLAMLGPLSGLALEMVLAWRFGASEIMDSYRIAVLFLYFGNQLFMGQLLPHVVVPMLSEYSSRGKRIDGWRLAMNLSLIGALVSLVLVLWVWSNSDLVVRFLAPGFNKAGRGNAAILVKYFSVALLFTSWAGTLGGILYSERVFWVQPVSQLAYNLGIIAGVVFLAGPEGVGALAVSVVLSSMLSFGIHIANVFRTARRFNFKFLDCLRPGPWNGVRKALYLLGPLAVTVLLSQWYIAVINRSLSHLPVGTLANFGFAWKMLVPLNILTASLAIVVFPMLSDARFGGDREGFQRLVTRGIRMTLFLSCVTAVVLWSVRHPLLGILFGRGNMTTEAVLQVSIILGVLLASGPGMALNSFLFKVAYSMQDTWTPSISTLASAVGITVVLPFAQDQFGAVGVAGAVSLITWICVLGMLGFQMRYFQIVNAGGIARFIKSMVLLSTGLLLITLFLRTFLGLLIAPGWPGDLLIVTGVVSLSFPSAYWLAILLRIEEAREVWGHICSRWAVFRGLLISGGKEG